MLRVRAFTRSNDEIAKYAAKLINSAKPKEIKIKVSKNNVSINNQQVPILQNTSTVKENTQQINKVSSGLEVTSPIIGTAYHNIIYYRSH